MVEFFENLSYSNKEKYLNYPSQDIPMFMHKRIVGEYIKDELKKGKTFEQIRNQLMKTGYNKEDVNGVLRTFEYREADLKSKEHKLDTQKTKVHELITVVLIVCFLNTALFFYYFYNPNYLLVKKTPIGLFVVGLSFLLFWIFFYFYVKNDPSMRGGS